MNAHGSRAGVAFLSNQRLSPGINWSTLGPPLAQALVDSHGARIVAPPPLAERRSWREWAAVRRRLKQADAVFWMQLSSRPDREIMAASVVAGRVRRAAYTIDAWPYAWSKIAAFARLQRLRPCFIAFRPAYEALSTQYPRQPFAHLPFGVDTDVFVPCEGPKDIFAFSMGRRHPPIHDALVDYCNSRGLTYVASTGGAIKDPHELGALAARSRYFVVTPPDLDHPQRAGGISPLVMRYLEGLSAGSRLLGTLPGSGEFERIVPVESILQIAADGTDLAARLDADVHDDSGFAAAAEATRIVRAEHGWANRAEQIARVLSDGS